MAQPIAGDERLRVLIAEDWGVIAADIARVVEEFGFATVGPFGTCKKALEAARSVNVDAALLDVNLHDETSYVVTDLLIGRGKPVVFLTGYARDRLPQRYRDVPCLEKPFTREDFKGIAGHLSQRR